MVNLRTWEAIARRHMRYRDLLAGKLAEWPQTRIDACTDMREFRKALKLAERSERHEDRVSRHLERALVTTPAAGVSRSRMITPADFEASVV